MMCLSEGRHLGCTAVVVGSLVAGATLVAAGASPLPGSERTVDRKTSAAAFPGDNGRIAYSVYDGNDYDLYTINADGSRRRQLTDTTVDEYRPAWSPNARRIAYQVYGNADSDIFTIMADGSGRRRLTDNDVDDLDPAWSPTGKRIAPRHERRNGFSSSCR